MPGFQAQVVEQRRIHPHFAYRGNRGFQAGGGWLTHIRQEEQFTAQWVTWLHRFEGHQAAGSALLSQGASHGGKAHIGVGLQTHVLGLLHKSHGCALVTDDHRIATQQLPRIAPQTRLHSVSQKPYRRERCHRQRHRQHEQAQLACTQITP